MGNILCRYLIKICRREISVYIIYIIEQRLKSTEICKLYGVLLMKKNKNYEYIENPMVLPEYKSGYDEEEEYEIMSYLEDVGWEDAKDKSLGL